MGKCVYEFLIIHGDLFTEADDCNKIIIRKIGDRKRGRKMSAEYTEMADNALIKKWLSIFGKDVDKEIIQNNK